MPVPIKRIPTSVATTPHIIITARKLIINFVLSKIFIIFPEKPWNLPKIQNSLKEVPNGKIPFFSSSLISYQNCNSMQADTWRTPLSTNDLFC
ncbi:hypothetical protein ES703_94896 [subsurface metagenome]